MEELQKTAPKLPSQEFDYYKISKILLSRWYWIAGSVLVCYLASNVYLWYTPKIYATSAIIKFEEKNQKFQTLLAAARAPTAPWHRAYKAKLWYCKAPLCC
ncbi:Wzz/FepE/Etk N-terminal domain-containing protein [Mucilaginibacter antarcticus]|uniref:Wzz/FepE/Etk N-terminal domain-containing protein n=1 Tax=Mucilaginibacter antarcticus TaxID=1855725 RepID=UPI003633719E